MTDPEVPGVPERSTPAPKPTPEPGTVPNALLPLTVLPMIVALYSVPTPPAT